MNKTLYIFGAKSTALEIKEIAEQDYDFSKIFLVDKEYTDLDNDIISEKDLQSYNNLSQSFYIIAMSDFEVRKKCIGLAEKLKLIPISIISYSSYISKTAKIGEGVYIAPNSSISSNAIIKEHCIVNFNCTVGHDSIIKQNTILNPGVRISGNCTINSNVLIGANSFIHQNKIIGDNTQIDAMTHIFKDIPESKICTSRFVKIFDNNKLKG